MSENVRLQDLREFTVQIRDPDDNIAGTGIVVEFNRVITCAHVVEAAIGKKPKEARDRTVGVYLPKYKSREPVKRKAIVDRCFPNHDDDIVCLRLIDGPVPLGQEQFAKLGPSEQSEDNPFRSYGYSPTGGYPATRASGLILGSIEPPMHKMLLVDPIQLKSTEIAPGMSGSAILDTELNLVVGLVTERYFPETWVKGDIAYAVDNLVLTFDPFLFALHDKAFPKGSAPEPRIDKAEAKAAVKGDLGFAWSNAPSPLKEWAGRKQLLQDITSDWISSDVRITGLIGFGGEGKSSLARRWVDELLVNRSLPQPDGIFWWGFYEKRNVDEFFEAALKYLSGGKIDARKILSSNVRAQIIAAMLGAGSYLFILDGLEVLQYQQGDMYGSLLSSDLKDFLELFASPDHKSFCLVTSRAPLMDLESFTTYHHRNVDRLSSTDGRDMLHNLSIRGEDEKLDGLVEAWEGHALTLSLLASYLVDHHKGDIKQVGKIPSPTANESRYERVHKVLRRYDEHFDNAERAFLKLFSVFRVPVKEDALDKVFKAKSEKQTTSLNAPIIALNKSDFKAMVQRLATYRIIRYEPDTDQYTIHPLIRTHYLDVLEKCDADQAKEVHFQIKEYYMLKAQSMPDHPTLEDFRPLIEAVYHACRCGAYDDANDILWERIYKHHERYLVSNLGAWETSLAIMRELFPDGDISSEPLVGRPKDKGWVLNEIGLCLGCIGRGDLAEGPYKRALKIALDDEDWGNACQCYQNLSQLYSLQGDLIKSAQTAYQALKLARRNKDKEHEINSLVRYAWVTHLQGDVQSASRAFQEAETLERAVIPSISYLFSSGGILHAEHLMRVGKTDYARKVTEANLQICEKIFRVHDISRCHRILGDLYAMVDQHKAGEQYYKALSMAHSISMKLVLIEALMARGRWAAHQLQDATTAFSDLNEALGYAKAGGYHLYEADIQVSLAWAHFVAGNKDVAKEEAIYAKRISQSMGYYWGKVDAEEVLAEINKQA